MDAIRSQTFHIAARTVLTLLGLALLWWAPTTVAGLVLMLIGLICAVSGLLAGDFVPNTLDLIAGHVQATVATRRLS